MGRARQQTHDYVQNQIRRTFQVIKDLPPRRRRGRRGWGARLLSSITGLASEEELAAVVDILQRVEVGVQQSLKMWGDGANQLTAAFEVEQERITSIMHLMGAKRKLVRDIQTEFLEYRRDSQNYYSKVMAKIVSLLNGEVTYREEADLLYHAAQQLMAGNLPHFLLSHENMSSVLTHTQNYLQQRQPHMTLSRLDFGYYYSEASFSTFRRGNRVFIAIDAPVIFQLLKMPFHVYEVLTFPLSTHHQNEFYSTLATDISTLAFSRDADYFLQIEGKNAKPVGPVWDVSHSAVGFIDRSRPTCGNALLRGDLSVIKSHCGYVVRRAPYPRGVIRLYENTFLFVNITSLHVRCMKRAISNDTIPMALTETAILVSRPLALKSFDCHCESVTADEYMVLIDMSYCNTTTEFTQSMDIQFPINLAYLTEYFDLEELYNLTAQTFLDKPVDVMLPDLAIADKLWDEVMAKEEIAKFDMKEIINATKHSAEVYDSLAHYLFTKMAVAHYKPTDFDPLSPWAWMSIFGWILSVIAVAMAIMLKIKIRSLTMVLMARAAHAAPAGYAAKLPTAIGSTTIPSVTTDSLARWADQIAHLPNLLPAEVLILMILIFWTIFKIMKLFYSYHLAKTARTRLVLEIGNITDNVLLSIIDLPHPSRYYKIQITKQAVELALMETNFSFQLMWHKGITMTNTILEMPIRLPSTLSVPLWKIKKLRSLLQMPHYVAVQIVSDITTHDMEVIPLRVLPPEAMNTQLYPSLGSISFSSLTHVG